MKSDIIGVTDEANYRIAHISDTHVSPEYNRFNIVRLKTLLGHVIDEGFDHVAITGDITAHAEEREYRSVRRLLKYYGLLDYEKLTVTIGNHDVFGGVHRAEDIFSFGNHCRNTSYEEKVRLFERTFRETFPRKAYGGESLFPFVKIVGPVALIGMNSIREFHAFLNPVGSNGLVRKRELEAVERILRHPSMNGLKKIVLIHHHFNKYRPYADSIGARLYHRFESRTLKLHRQSEIETVFKDTGVDVVLHGHTHVEGIYSRRGILYSSTALMPVAQKDGDAFDDVGKGLRFNEISISENRSIVITRRSASVQPKGSSSRAFDRKLHGE